MIRNFLWNWNLISVCSFLASQWRYWNIWECLTVLITAGSALRRQQSGEHVSRKHGQLRWSAAIQKRYTASEGFVENYKETGESASKHFEIPRQVFLIIWYFFWTVWEYERILKTKYMELNSMSLNFSWFLWRRLLFLNPLTKKNRWVFSYFTSLLSYWINSCYLCICLVLRLYEVLKQFPESLLEESALYH